MTTVASEPSQWTDQDHRFMGRALELAQSAMEDAKFPVGAVVVFEGVKIAEAANRVAKLAHLAHAEILAVRDAMKNAWLPLDNRPDMVLYTTLEPCMMCLGAIMNYNIEHLHYALEAPGDGAARFAQEWDRLRPPETHRRLKVPQMTAGLRRSESLRVFELFLERHPHSPLIPGVKDVVGCAPARWNRTS